MSRQPSREIIKTRRSVSVCGLWFVRIFPVRQSSERDQLDNLLYICTHIGTVSLLLVVDNHKKTSEKSHRKIVTSVRPQCCKQRGGGVGKQSWTKRLQTKQRQTKNDDNDRTTIRCSWTLCSSQQWLFPVPKDDPQHVRSPCPTRSTKVRQQPMKLLQRQEQRRGTTNIKHHYGWLKQT